MQPASPAAKNTAATGCLIAFSLPFLFIGVAALIGGGLQLWHGKPLREAGLVLIFGLIFTGVAVTFVTVMIKSTRWQAERDALRAREADRPWLWRKEWAEGVMRDHSGAVGWFLVIFGTFWSLVSFPAFYLAWRNQEKEQWVLLIVGLFPLIGVLLLISAVYQLLRRQRYGVSRCTVDRIPITPGRAFSGTIEAKIHEAPQNGFDMKLSCVRRVVTGSGKSRSVNESVVWQEEQTISGARAMPSPNGMRIPFTFHVPRDAEPCDERDSNNSVLWRLDVSAEVPGVNYAAQFELPVFRTGFSEETPEPEPHVPDAHDAALAVATPSPDSRIAISRLPSGGEEYRLALRAGFMEVFFYSLFLLAWWAGTIAMIWFRAPVCFPLAFVFFGILIAIGGIDLYLGRSHVKADRAGLTVRRTWVGAGKPVFYPRDQIASLGTATSSSSGGKVNYSIVAKLTDGREVRVARYTRIKRDAEIVAARVGRALGL